MKVLTKKEKKDLENLKRNSDVREVLEYLSEIQKKKKISDEEMENDLDVVLWKAFVYINIGTYEVCEFSQKALEKVKEKGQKNVEWCYRYSVTLTLLRKYDEAFKYAKLGTEVDEAYPWCWLELAKLYYKNNFLDEAYKAIDKGLELLPDNQEFLEVKEDMENNRDYTVLNLSKTSKDDFLDFKLEDERLYEEFLKKSDLEKEIDFLHEIDEHKKIIEKINAISEKEKNYSILGRLGRAYNNNEEYEKALEVLFKIEKQGKNNSTWNYRVGYAYIFMQDYEKAKKYLEKSLKINPMELDADYFLEWAYSGLSAKYFEEGKFEEGLKCLKINLKNAKSEESIFEAEIGLAYAYNSIGEYKKAYKYLKKLEKSGKIDFRIYFQLGYCLNNLNKNKEAMLMYKKAEEIDKNHPLLNYNIAFLLKEEGEIEESLKYYEKAKSLGVEGYEINLEMAYSLMELRRYEEALNLFNESEKNKKDDSSIEGGIGFCLKKMGKYKEALKHFLRAEEILGENNDWLKHFDIAECLGETGEISKAIERLEIAFKFEDSDKILINSNLGYLYGKSGEYNKALKYLNEAKKMGRNDWWIYAEIGWDLSNIDKYHEALEYLNKSIEAGGDGAWLNTQMGYVLKKIGNYEEAIKYFKKVKEIYNDFEDIKYAEYHLGNTYRNMGKIQEAIEIFKNLEERGYGVWVELDLSICYALIGNEDKAIEYLEKAKENSNNKEINEEQKKDFELANELIQSLKYVN